MRKERREGRRKKRRKGNEKREKRLKEDRGRKEKNKLQEKGGKSLTLKRKHNANLVTQICIEFCLIFT